MSAADVFLALLIAAVVAGVAALIALPFVYLRGMKQIREIDYRIRMDRERDLSAANVRALSKWETARRMERKAR